MRSIILEYTSITHIPDSTAWDGRIGSIVLHGSSLKEIPTYIFGRKTNFNIPIVKAGVKLPSPEKINPCTNIRLWASRELRELNEEITALNKKMNSK